MPRELPARLRLVADLFCRQLLSVKVIAARRGVPIKRAVELCESLADYPEAIKEVTDGKFAPKTSHDFLEMPAFKAKNESALSEAKYKEDQIRYEFERAAEIKADAEQATTHARGDE